MFPCNAATGFTAGRARGSQGTGTAITAPHGSHEELLARIGRDYYLRNRSKVEIAREHGLSRFQVARLLEEARALGIVRIEVSFPDAVPPQDELQAALGVSRLVIVPAAADDAGTRDQLARAAAAALAEAVAPDSTVGISWSRTLDRAAAYLTALPPCAVVQLAGALPVPGTGNSMELVQTLGKLPGVRTWPLWAPLVVGSAETAASLRGQPEVADALGRADALDLAVVAIGAWAPGLSTVWPRVDNPLRLAAARAGAVAECSGRLLDAEGRPVPSELDERVLAVTVAQLQATPQVIAVAQGAERAEAVLATLRAGFITTLIIDSGLAAALAALAAEA
ncbi:Transcriptional regulator LsrR [Arthrobacter saudimassiliensis]|uniref:Transcriptional regulator LsrR n=1 Tax=Arthrobacter saudimassiliensis TaxID=1461584 RepID=A0A078MIY6_9MICC|nr:Transcriptional regulator LsrR [Arthrobacter saudimassiliensis]